ncbi:MAG: flagellar basal body P-ring protein FlgI [Phycisphaerales bacterium]
MSHANHTRTSHAVAAGLALLGAVFAFVAAAAGTTVGEIARIQGQGESIIAGLGLVVGLPGTGDAGKDLVIARPLAEVYRNNGIPVPDLSDLKNAKTVALVWVTCTISESGARTDDTFDCAVMAQHSAKSLKGGRLIVTPLRHTYRGGEVYGFAEGEMIIEDTTTPTVARVRHGVRMIRDVNTGRIPGDSFTLVLRPYFSGWPAASSIAAQITQEVYGRPDNELGSLPPVATVLDDRTVRIDIPEAERGNRAGFVADVMSTRIDSALLKLPAQVVCNGRTGAIIVTGDVEISPAAITHKDLTITTTIPTPVPTAANPLLETARWTDAGTRLNPVERAKLQDLLAVFKQLNIPVTEQIAVLEMLHKGGQLQARLILD